MHKAASEKVSKYGAAGRASQKLAEVSRDAAIMAASTYATQKVAAKIVKAIGAARKAKYENLVAKARQMYPKKAGIIQNHHLTPQYLGGAKNGLTVKLDAAYHQQITNAFRKLAPYGKPRPSMAKVQAIMKQVYSQFPLPH